LQVGQEQVVLVRNNTGSALSDGQVVYITGSTGEIPTVALANNKAWLTASRTLGVVTEPISHGAQGYVTLTGIINGLNTNAFTEGAAIWLDSLDGQFTETMPQAPYNEVLLGYIVKKAGGNGSIFVRSQNSFDTSFIRNQFNAKENKTAWLRKIKADTVIADNFNGVLAATSGQVRQAVSGTDIKTINSTSILGSGDISVGGVTTMGAIGATPNANGATISGNTLTLQPASASFGGVVTTLAQTFSGRKTFPDRVTAQQEYRNDNATGNPSTYNYLSNGTHIGVSGNLNYGTFASTKNYSTAVQANNGTGTIFTFFDNETRPDLSFLGVKKATKHASLGILPIYTDPSADTVWGILYRPNLNTTPLKEYAAIFATGQVGVGIEYPLASAKLDITSTTQGVLIPRLTTIQQTAIASPATGLMIWNTDSLALCEYTGVAWRKVDRSGGSAGITSLNGLTGATQTFTTGTTGTDFGISSSGTTHTFNLPTASSVNRGALSTADWTTFNNKQPSIDTLTSTLLADVSMPSSGVWYSGPSVTLPVGTWMVMAHLSHTGGAANANVTIRLDGTTAAAQGFAAASRMVTLPTNALVSVASGTTTITLQAMCSTTSTAIAYQTLYQSQPGATRIIAVKIK
jgi:Uncharacterized conserved protein (DUF2190)